MLPQPLPSSGAAATVTLLSLIFVNGVWGNASTPLQTSHSLSGFPPCDALVSRNLSHAVRFPSSPLYPSLVENGSYAIDTRKQPWCFVLPSTTSEVSEVLTALTFLGNGAGDWHVAVRSGGHGRDSQNNIADGVTIDLTHLNTTSYNSATNIASVGTGARWGAVYAQLENHGVTVTGGREGAVGVGGLLLGGGISWYSARTGFACDNVINFEVVLASGKVINANATANPDLWRALKGGSSNFGIVTRFDLEAFPAENLAIQERVIAREYSNQLIDAFEAFTNLGRSFDDDALISIMTYNPMTEDSTFAVTEVNTKNKANSTAFGGLNRIPTISPATRQSLSLVELSNRTQLSGKYRNAASGALTIINDPRVMRYCLEQYDCLVEDMKVLLGPKNFSTILDFQPFPSYFSDISVQKGGNMLGLEHDSRNKVLFTLGVTLRGSNSEELFPRVYQQVVAVYERIERFSKSIGSDSNFRYLPYADARENPIGSYGRTSVEHIRNVAAKYDPSEFFQRMVPGGFKINRVR